MSYFHNSYSTLEDAWGVDFINKKKPKKKPNSVCNLYESRNAPLSKPYASKTKKSSKDVDYVNNDEHFDSKYYGYSDAHKFSKKRSKVHLYKPNYSPEKTNAYDSGDENAFDDFLPMSSSNEKLANSTCYTSPEKYKQVPSWEEASSQKAKPWQKKTKKPATMKNQFMYIDEENDSDEEYQIQRPVSTKRPPVMNDSYDSDEEFDQYLESKMLQKSIDAEEEYEMMIKGNNIDEEETTPSRRHKPYYTEESEEQYDSGQEDDPYSAEEESYYPKKTKKTKKQRKIVKPTFDEIQMELLLYTITGIIFIFIMEQFVQIGMKLKKVY